MSLEEQLSAVDSFHSAVSDARHESTKFKQGIDIMKTKLREDCKDAKEGTAIVTTIKTAGAAIPDLTSGDPTRTLTALFGIVGSVAETAGPTGVVISIALSLVSGIIGGCDQGTGQSVTDMIKDLMQHFHDEDMRDKAAGIYQEFRVAMNTMNGYDDFVVRVDSLDSEVHNGMGVKFLGKLANDNFHAGQAKNLDEAQKVLGFVHTYCILSLQRELILRHKWVLLKLSGHPSTHSLEEVIIGEVAENRKQLHFIHFPSVKEAAVASVYNPRHWPRISAYMKHVGVPDPLHPEPKQQGMRVRDSANVIGFVRSLVGPVVGCAYFTRIVSSKFWLIHRRVEKKFNNHAYQYLTMYPHWIGPDTVSYDESPLSPEDYIQEGKANEFNSIIVTFIDENTCLLAAKAAPCAFFQTPENQFLNVAFSVTMLIPRARSLIDHFDIEAHIGVSEEDSSHWSLVSLKPE